jgi:hypothetical protein
LSEDFQQALELHLFLKQSATILLKEEWLLMAASSEPPLPMRMLVLQLFLSSQFF